jgi:mannose-6-phosphate isomerase
MQKSKLYPLILSPTIKNYVWGGKKLLHLLDRNERSDPQKVAEIWAIYGENRIKNGSYAGVRLVDLQQERPEELLGFAETGKQWPDFPILIKILDCQEWLSIQVHPDDEQARLLESPHSNGKTETWFCLDSEPGSKIYAGSKPGISSIELIESIKKNTILDSILVHEINKNDYIMIDAGVIHALGPGLTIYELQQNADVTYRVYDWDRPATAGRPLHIEKAGIAAKNIQTYPRHILGNEKTNSFETLIDCQYFKLGLISNKGNPIEMNTNLKSLHALTVSSGELKLQFEDLFFTVNNFETILIPACLGKYQLSGEFSVLLASLA